VSAVIRHLDLTASATMTTILAQYSAPTSRESGMFRVFLVAARIMAQWPQQEDDTNAQYAPILPADGCGHNRFLVDLSQP
jgi:hypothetical protein